MVNWIELATPEEAEKVAARVRHVALAVHREVGPGYREHVYQACLAHALREAGFRVEERVKLNVRFRGLVIANAAEADLIVNGIIVVELKARDEVHPAQIAQLVGYLRSTGARLGLLFNFHAIRLMKDGYERVVHPRYLVMSE